MMMDVDSDDGMNDAERYRRKFPPKRGQADENVVLELKNKVTKKKGRGFQETPHERDGSSHDDDYEQVHPLTGEDDEDYLKDDNFPQRSVEGWILMVTNLHEEIQEEDIMDKFGDFGPVKNMHLNLDRRTGFVKGYCLVEFETYREALLAKEAMNDSKLLGQTIAVDWAFVKNPRKIPASESKRRRRNRY